MPRRHHSSEQLSFEGRVMGDRWGAVTPAPDFVTKAGPSAGMQAFTAGKESGGS